MQGYRVWFDRLLSVITGLIVVTVAYFVVTERVVPALRGEPVRVWRGERLPEVLEFVSLGGGDDSRGRPKVRIPNGRATLMLVYNSTCQACYRTLPAWRRAVSTAADGVAVLAVGLDPDRRGAALYARHNLPAAAVVAPDDPVRFAHMLGIDIVPFTAVMDPAGVLVFARQGSLDRQATDSLISALGVLGGS
ncbi:MAG: hypothetical protein PVI01_08565 [Gemmatimonadales bacterium]